MKKMKFITCFLAVTLVAASLAGCGESASDVSSDDSTLKLEQEENQNQQPSQNDRGTMGKVVSMDGDTITVILADESAARNGDGGTPPTVGTAPEAGQTPPPADSDAKGEGTTGSGVNGAGGAPREKPDQGREGGGAAIEFTGDETTYPLSDEVTVTTGMGELQSKIDLSEIAVSSVIRFTTQTVDDGKEVIISIQVME